MPEKKIQDHFPIQVYHTLVGDIASETTYIISIDILKAEFVAVPIVPVPKNFHDDRAIYKKIPFFTNFHVAFVKKTVGLLRTQF